MGLLLLEKLEYYVFKAWYPDKYTACTCLRDVALIQLAIRQRKYRFQPMYRTFMEKPKKPGKFRPITEPANQDRLILDAMAHLLCDELVPFFLNASHGFRNLWIQNQKTIPALYLANVSHEIVELRDLDLKIE